MSVDLMKLKGILEILGICVTVAMSYVFIINLVLGIQNQPVDIVILAFAWAMVIKMNWTAKELWDKWTGKWKNEVHKRFNRLP